MKAVETVHRPVRLRAPWLQLQWQQAHILGLSPYLRVLSMRIVRNLVHVVLQARHIHNLRHPLTAVEQLTRSRRQQLTRSRPQQHIHSRPRAIVLVRPIQADHL